MLPGLLISTLSAVCAIIEHGLQTVLAGAEPVIAGYRCQGRLWGLIDAGPSRTYLVKHWYESDL